MHKKAFVLLAGLVLAAAIDAGEPGKPAPDFTLPARSGGDLSLSDLEGEVVMINFWASWCPPCLQEMPHLEAIYRRYAPVGFTLLGVNVEDDVRAAERWLEQRPVSFEILYDRANKVSELYDVIAMPTTVLIDREGNTRFVHHGYLPGYEEDYRTQVRQLVRE